MLPLNVVSMKVSICTEALNVFVSPLHLFSVSAQLKAWVTLHTLWAAV